MDIKNLTDNISIGAKPCIKWGTLTDLFVDENGSLRGKVTVVDLDDPLNVSFYYTCQHWIYNRLIPGMAADDTGYSSFCLGDSVMVYIGPVDNIAIGRYDETASDMITHQPCWPIFVPSKSFAVAPVSASNYLNSWAPPFLGSSLQPFDFINPFIDSLGEIRPLGTYTTVATSSGRHIRLITEHSVENTQILIAHTLHEVLSTFPTGVFLCPSTTENSRYFLGRKITYNSSVSRFILDDIAIVSGIIDNGQLISIALVKIEEKIFIGTFSKLLDRISTVWNADFTDVHINLSVAYFDYGRIDHLFCMKGLIDSGGEQSINELPEAIQSQTETVLIQRDVFCVRNVGPAVVSNSSGLHLLFLGFGAEPAGVARSNYEIDVIYDAELAQFGVPLVTEHSPYLWEPQATGGGISSTRTGGTPLSSFPQNYDRTATISAQVFNGPDYPSVIGGDHTFTIGLYGSSSDGVFSDEYSWAKNEASQWTTDSRSVSSDYSIDTVLIFKHDGVEITRATSYVDSHFSQSMDIDVDSRNITGSTTSYSSTLSMKEIHWFVVRPDLEFYIFNEVSVFENHTPYTSYPPPPVTSKYYAWYRGTKIELSSSSKVFPSEPTIQEYLQYIDMVGNPGIRSDAADGGNLKNYFSIKGGTVKQATGTGTYTFGISLPGYPLDGEDTYNNTLNIFVPRGYILQDRIWDKNSTHTGLSNEPLYEGYRNAGGALLNNSFSLSPVLSESGTSWVSPLEIYNSAQVYKQYPNHWSWLAESNEINQKTFGIGDTSFSAPRVFTYQKMSYHAGVYLGDPQFFGDYLYITIPDVFTAGLVHEFFSGPPEMLDKIRAAINPNDPEDVIFATTIS